MRRALIAAIAGPVLLWGGLVVIGRKRADESGTAVFTGSGQFLHVRHGLLIESMAAGVLAGYLVGYVQR